MTSNQLLVHYVLWHKVYKKHDKGAFQKHLWALKSKSSYIFTCELNPYLSMYGQDILYGISKVPFEIPHIISYPHIERHDLYTTLKF